MKHSRLSHALLGSALSLALVVPWSAHAALSDSKVCPALSPEVHAPAGVQVPEVCYSGFNCTVGMRGDWLDITNKVSIAFLRDLPINGLVRVRSPDMPYASAEASIAARGVQIRAPGSCVPVSQKDREGYVAVLLEEIKGTGGAIVNATRPAFTPKASDSNSLSIEVRDGTHFLHPMQRAALSTRVGEVKTIDLTGRGLKDLRITVRKPTNTAIKFKPGMSRTASAISGVKSGGTPQQLLEVQTPTVSIVSQSYNRLSLQVNFDRAGTFNLDDYLEFTVGDPAINRDLGWPSIEVRP